MYTYLNLDKYLKVIESLHIVLERYCKKVNFLCYEGMSTFSHSDPSTVLFHLFIGQSHGHSAKLEISSPFKNMLTTVNRVERNCFGSSYIYLSS